MLRDGKVGQPLAAPPLYGCRIPLAGEGCARDYARRRVSERNRRKAALSAEITQEGIHRRPFTDRPRIHLAQADDVRLRSSSAMIR